MEVESQGAETEWRGLMVAGPLDEQGSTLKMRGTLLPDDKWHYVGESGEPSFENSWVNYDTATFAAARFIKDASGVVHIEGLVKSGTVPETIFTLPEGYRPTQENLLTVQQSNTGVARLDILPEGDVYANTGGNGWFSIHVSFYVG